MQGAPGILIRRYLPDELEKVRALEARVQPYRPEDRDAVRTMHGRARQAELYRDRRRMPQTPPMPDMGLILWVAETTPDRAIVGLVGLSRAGVGPEAPSDEPLVAEWLDRDDVAELRRLRVAPERQRRGVATLLNMTAIEWARCNGADQIVLNTTSAQVPALRRYRKLGFQEQFRSFVGRYELIWLALKL